MGARLLTFLIVGVFATVLGWVGATMLRTRSIAAEMTAFETGRATTIHKFFYGWSIPLQLPFHKFLLKIFGDGVLTFLWRAMGLLVLLLAVGLVVVAVASLFVDVPSMN